MKILFFQRSKDKSLKPGLKRKFVYKHEAKSEIVTTPAIRRAYFSQVLIRTVVEGGFLYMQVIVLNVLNGRKNFYLKVTLRSLHVVIERF